MFDQEPRSLESVCDLITDGSHFSPVPQSDAYPIVNAKDIPNGHINLDTCTRISKADWNTLKKQKCSPVPGDVLLSKDGTIGRVVHYQSDLGVVVLSSIAILRPKPSLDPAYLAQALRSDAFRQQLLVLESGSALRRIILRDIKRLAFSFPTDTTEQVKIAEVLSNVDRVIEQTEALISKQERIKTGLMQDVLTSGIDEHGNVRSEQTHKFKDSCLGRVPLEWDVQSLGTALRRSGGFLQTGPFGSQLHAYEYVHEGIPVVMPQDILSGVVSTAFIAKITESRAADLRRHRLQLNDIVFSRRGDLSRAAAIGERETGWVCGTGCFLLRVPAGKMDAAWLADTYRHHHVQRQVETNAVGSTMPSLNNAVMEQLMIAFPSIHEQREIMRRLKKMDETICTMRNGLNKLLLLKNGLMQDLLSGRKRVTELLRSKPNRENVYASQ